jgi:hypothetical protein
MKIVDSVRLLKITRPNDPPLPVIKKIKYPHNMSTYCATKQKHARARALKLSLVRSVVFLNLQVTVAAKQVSKQAISPAVAAAAAFTLH